MYTINDVAQIFSVSPYTLRFYAKKDLFPNIVRDKQNTRLFSDKDLEYVEMVLALRHTGMSLPSIKNYIDLCALGDESIIERLSIIQDELNNAEKSVKESIKQRDILKDKLSYYQKAIEVGETNVTWSAKHKLK
ncbi:MerR family transcriptional regulator [Leuconostoc pseudomesenteroides]|jgi:DNA-binding transcriptional MerR regulator|uniref:MerR family transcriptional regulator n=1 Tax=Leuconostoc falkenbergense TaxID=2766470 RepID=A0ABT7S0P5_9LACO|nr:MerR family transcriptional regulator [Leuconostoc falkenbergense]RDG19116.1 MerR family transcriptional regulator [Leuconostoc pseudomesenteroides]MCT4410753.1 MerR family transcriptional regulator [Leuconostoc falkenbergense]MDM7647122.1 MerR family transcriptional regulator [Leuconostoc falkenbergense]MDY5164575.1 MerR family transcriptional regulator [Leuconostoc falkenbergense]VTU67904.1 transcriptional regulator [Lactobacillus brevis] [Leuconostoc pseudomesenteroides]